MQNQQQQLGQMQKQQQQKRQDMKPLMSEQILEGKSQQFLEGQKENEEQFQVLQALSPEELQRLNQQKKNQLIDLYSTCKQYEISSWYQALQQFTFKSLHLDITAIQAYILYRLYFSDHNKNLMEQLYPQVIPLLRLYQLHAYYQKLKAKIDNFLKTNKETLYYETKNQSGSDKTIACFMKLSTRSPKDYGYKYSPDQIQKISNQLTSYIKRQDIPLRQTNLNTFKKQLSKKLINQIYRFFLELSKQKLKIKSAQDFIDIFTSSQRILIDISDLSDIKDNVFESFQKGIDIFQRQSHLERADEKFIELWARQWVDFDWHQQFRCFYYDYKLTGISQYDQRCYFPEIQSKSSMILQRIKKFFDSMLPYLQKLNLSQGVMDLVVFGLEDKKIDEIQIKLIEINVFNRNSRPSLYSWDRDIEILTNKIQKPLQVRILTQPINMSKHELLKLMGMIDKGTQQIIQKSMVDLGLQQLWNAFE